LLIGAYGALDGQADNAGDLIALNGGNSWGVSPSNWLLGSVAGGMRIRAATGQTRSL